MPQREGIRVEAVEVSPGLSGGVNHEGDPIGVARQGDKVALLIYNYLNATQNGKPVSSIPFVTNILYSWYGDEDVPRERAETENVDYCRHWPDQAIESEP